MTSINARIAEIQRLVNAPAPGSTTATQRQSSVSTTTASGTATADSFASVLANAQSSLSLDQIKAFGNGRIPAGALTPIGVGDHKLAGPAADAFKRMKADASRAGITFGVNDSYRSYDEQVEMARKKGLYSQGGLAATPGKSEHGFGLSLDLQLNSKSLAWMKANAGRYGFVNNVAGESWHWTYKGK